MRNLILIAIFLLNQHVKHFPPTWSVETFINRCSETAGIQLGRTTRCVIQS